MAHLDIGKTAFSGFGVIRRNPLSPLVWGLIHAALAIGPLLLILPTMIEFMQTAFASAHAGGEPDMAEIMRLQQKMSFVSPLSWISQLFALGLINGAIFRAVLFPKDSAWFYLRFGMREVMLVVVSIVFGVLFVVALVVGVILVAIVGFALAQISQSVGIIGAVVGGLAVAGVIIWGALRFSMSFAMSFDRQAFQLFESWRVTAGQAGSLFAMGLINVIVVMVLEWIVLGALFAVAATTILGGGGFEALSSDNPSAYFTPARLMSYLPWGIGLVTVTTMLAGYLTVLMTVPWAEAYRSLRPATEDTV